MTISVEHNTNLIDVALQYYGSIEGLDKIVTLNALSYNSNITAGKQLVVDGIDTLGEQQAKIVGNFKKNNIIVASGNFEENTFNNSFNNSYS